ncbi:MAG: FixH family protein [Candidatus Sericytochromatia bacterium]
MINKKIIFLFLALVFLLGTPTNSYADTFNTQQIFKKNFGKGLNAALEVDTKTFSKASPTSVKLTLQDKYKDKIENAQVTLDLTMPSMYMPDNKVKLKETEKGIYTGQMMFTMKGDWRINVLISSKNKKQKLYFDIVVE